eukprot:IDg7987t1
MAVPTFHGYAARFSLYYERLFIRLGCFGRKRVGSFLFKNGDTVSQHSAVTLSLFSVLELSIRWTHESSDSLHADISWASGRTARASRGLELKECAFLKEGMEASHWPMSYL